MPSFLKMNIFFFWLHKLSIQESMIYYQAKKKIQFIFRYRKMIYNLKRKTNILGLWKRELPGYLDLPNIQPQGSVEQIVKLQPFH